MVVWLYGCMVSMVSMEVNSKEIRVSASESPITNLHTSNKINKNSKMNTLPPSLFRILDCPPSTVHPRTCMLLHL